MGFCRYNCPYPYVSPAPCAPARPPRPRPVTAPKAPSTTPSNHASKASDEVPCYTSPYTSDRAGAQSVARKRSSSGGVSRQVGGR